jgi:hypothetical protein
MKVSTYGYSLKALLFKEVSHSTKSSHVWPLVMIRATDVSSAMCIKHH